MASLERMFPTEAVTYDHEAEPAAVVSQNIFQSTPITPQATFIPLHGTNPMARMMSSRRHTLPFPAPPIAGVEGSDEMWTGVTFSAVGSAEEAVLGGEGIDSGASAARTSASGFEGKRMVMSGANGRDSMYEKSDPVAVMTVRSVNAGMGSKTDPTRMFCRHCQHIIFLGKELNEDQVSDSQERRPLVHSKHVSNTRRQLAH